MTDAEDFDSALETLARSVQPDVEPTLSESELESILSESARAARWATVTDFSVGSLVLPTVNNGYLYRVVTEGTTAVLEPVWPETQAGTVTSGTVELEEAGLYGFTSLYDMRGALRKCWELKAAKSAEFISSTDSGSEQVIHENCRKMVEHYSLPMIA